jgi:DHA2 family multidrug resistance protein
MSEPGAPSGGWTPERSAAGDRSPWLIAMIISLATFMEVLDTSIANVSLDHIAGGLSVSYDQATWVLTSYLISNAIVVPVSGWLANVVGRKRFYMFSVALFTVSSLMCGLSGSLTMLVVSRVLQGIGGGGLAPSEQSMLNDTFPPKLRARAFALYGFVVVVAPVLGPTLGGWITETWTWNWIFFINVPVGILSLFLVHIFVEEPPKLQEDRERLFASGFHIDYLGFAFVALALGSLEYVLDRGQREDWFGSPAIRFFAVASAVGWIGLVIRELTVRLPVVDLRMLRDRSYVVSLLAMLATGMVLFASTQVIPQYLQQVMGYTAFDAGMALTVGGIGTIVVLPMTGRLAGIVQPKYLIILGMLIEAAAFWNFTNINHEISFSKVAVARLWQAVGLPLLFIPINVVAYAGIPPGKSNEVAAQLNLMRNLGGSIGISFAQTMIQRRSQWHQQRLVETLTPLDHNFRAWLADATRAVHSLGGPTGPGINRNAVAVIMQSVEQQASVLAFLDTFKALMVLTACVVPLLFLLRSCPKGTAAGHGG